MLEARHFDWSRRRTWHGAGDTDRRADGQAIDVDRGYGPVWVSVSLPPHPELRTGVGGVEVTRLLLVRDRRLDGHGDVGRERGAHEEEDGDEPEDDRERLAAFVAVERSHHHDLGAARRNDVSVSPLIPLRASVIRIVERPVPIWIDCHVQVEMFRMSVRVPLPLMRSSLPETTR